VSAVKVNQMLVIKTLWKIEFAWCIRNDKLLSAQ